MPKILTAFAVLMLSLVSLPGCGPSNEVTVSPVDDSVVHSEEDMKAMEESNAADMMSK